MSDVNMLHASLADNEGLKSSIEGLNPGDTISAEVSLRLDSIEGEAARFSVASITPTAVSEEEPPQLEDQPDARPTAASVVFKG